MTDDKTEKTKAGWLSRIWRVVVAATVFLAICAAIDLIQAWRGEFSGAC